MSTDELGANVIAIGVTNGAGPFNAPIQRIAVYDKALTATEVAALNGMLNGPSIPRYSVLQALNCA